MTDLRVRNGGDAEKNIALLIDADNASPDHLDEVLLVLGELGTINVRRAYGNWAKASLKSWGVLTGLPPTIPMHRRAPGIVPWREREPQELGRFGRPPLDNPDAAVRRRQGQGRDRHADDHRRD